MAPAFKVLAVDGGGIRGIIPALVLAAIEEQTHRQIFELFDLVAGTSTGGIIALGVTKPGPDGAPAGKAEKSAKSLIELYEREGEKIFPSSFLHGLHLSAVRGSKYDARGIDETLHKHFGDARLKDALTPVLVPTYDIEKQRPVFFKSKKAKAKPEDDFPMREVARATAAAPTYFTPAKLDTTDPLNYYALIDGGVVAGNPAMSAYAEAVRMLSEAESGPAEILLLSLGTGEQRHPLRYADACDWGQLEWAQPIIDIVLNGSNATVDYQLAQLLRTDSPQQSYFRFQVELSQDTGEMDDASDRNLKRLMDLTQNYLINPDTQDKLKRLCERLTAT